MAYNTGNPIGSLDPRDAADNKENFDRFALSTASTYTDRLGVERKTVTGALQDFSGYVSRGLWASGEDYLINEIWQNGLGGEYYQVLTAYTSGASAAADIASGNVALFQARLASDADVEAGTAGKVPDADQVRRFFVAGTAGRKYRIVGAAIRNTGAGWFFIDDSIHRNSGFSAISVVGGDIQVTHPIGATKIVSMVCTVDETFAQQGVIAGASVGTSVSLIKLTAPLEFTVNTASGAVSAPAIFGSKITASVVSGVCTVTHPEVLSDGPSTVSASGSAGISSRFTASYGPTATAIRAVGDLDGFIYYNGASWVYSGQMKTPPTLTWDSGTNELLVEHERCTLANISVSNRDAGYDTRVGSVGDVSFRVKFYDTALVQQTVQSTDMKFFFTRSAEVIKTDLIGTAAVRRGYAELDANDVATVGSNIWIYGIFEV